MDGPLAKSKLASLVNVADQILFLYDFIFVLFYNGSTAINIAQGPLLP